MGQQIDFCEEITVLLGESSRCGFNQSIFIPQGWSDSIQRKFTEATNLNSFKMVFVVLLLWNDILYLGRSKQRCGISITSNDQSVHYKRRRFLDYYWFRLNRFHFLKTHTNARKDIYVKAVLYKPCFWGFLNVKVHPSKYSENIDLPTAMNRKKLVYDLHQR